jgi:hypothetical protein
MSIQIFIDKVYKITGYKPDRLYDGSTLASLGCAREDTANIFWHASSSQLRPPLKRLPPQIEGEAHREEGEKKEN